MVVSHHYFGFEEGYAGVTFFYVLSGYVLTVNYPHLESPAARRAFWRKRFARIYPNHLLMLAFSVPVATGTLLALGAHLLLIQSWVPIWSVYFAFDAPSWSISNEAAFYAAFPWLLAWLRPAPSVRIFALGSAVAGFAAAWSILLPRQTLDSSATHFLFYIAPPLRLLEFALGVGLATTQRSAIGARHEVAALVIVALSFVIPAPPAFKAALVFIPAGVALVYVFSQSQGPLARALSSRALVLLGDASFALYMIHYPLRQYVLRWAGWSTGVAMLTALAAIALSVLMFRYFEKPMQRRLLRPPISSSVSRA